MNFLLNELKSPEIFYSIIIFALFVVPKIFIRLTIPPALTAFIVGVILGPVMGIGIGDATIQLLATIGISALFLFAGLEVDLKELASQKFVLSQHILIRFFLVVTTISILMLKFDLNLRGAGLLSLALFTPSVGFILDHLSQVEYSAQNRSWIRNLAISAEIVALVLLFIFSKSENFSHLLLSAFILVGLIFLLPLVFRFFLRHITPLAPGSEFSFLLMMAITAGLITKKIGAYYLIGAFTVGIIARRFESNLKSSELNTLMKTLKTFASFFMPFYFMKAGINLSPELFTLKSFLTGFGLVFVVGFIRVGTILIHRKIVLREAFGESIVIAVSLLPNLVFGLVIVGMLVEQSSIPSYLLGAIIVYTFGVTIIPTILNRFISHKFKSSEVNYLAQT